MPTKPLVLFDFDGVIADTAEATFELAKYIYEGLTRDEHVAFFDGNINDIKVNRQGRAVDYPKLYAPLLMAARVIPGIELALGELSQKYIMSIVSSTISGHIDEYLDKNDLRHYFDDVWGNDIHKRKDEKINMILEKYGAQSADAVFITDTVGDMKEAIKCNVPSIGVSWGFQDKERLKNGSPWAIANTPRELVLMINSIFHAKGH